MAHNHESNRIPRQIEGCHVSLDTIKTLSSHTSYLFGIDVDTQRSLATEDTTSEIYRSAFRRAEIDAIEFSGIYFHLLLPLFRKYPFSLRICGSRTQAVRKTILVTQPGSTFFDPRNAASIRRRPMEQLAVLFSVKEFHPSSKPVGQLNYHGIIHPAKSGRVMNVQSSSLLLDSPYVLKKGQ
jgi:hypothetical protein